MPEWMIRLVDFMLIAIQVYAYHRFVMDVTVPKDQDPPLDIPNPPKLGRIPQL